MNSEPLLNAEIANRPYLSTSGLPSLCCVSVTVINRFNEQNQCLDTIEETILAKVDQHLALPVGAVDPLFIK